MTLAWSSTPSSSYSSEEEDDRVSSEVRNSDLAHVYEEIEANLPLRFQGLYSTIHLGLSPLHVATRPLTNLIPRPYIFDLVAIFVIILVSYSGTIFSENNVVVAIFKFLLVYYLAASKYGLVLCLQRYENFLREVYSGRRRIHMTPEVRQYLSSPVINGIFNMRTFDHTRMKHVAKLLAVTWVFLILKRWMEFDDRFISNSVHDLSWLTFFWGILEIEYMHPPQFLMPLLLHFQDRLL